MSMIRVYIVELAERSTLQKLNPIKIVLTPQFNQHIQRFKLNEHRINRRANPTPKWGWYFTGLIVLKSSTMWMALIIVMGLNEWAIEPSNTSPLVVTPLERILIPTNICWTTFPWLLCFPIIPYKFKFAVCTHIVNQFCLN